MRDGEQWSLALHYAANKCMCVLMVVYGWRLLRLACCVRSGTEPGRQVIGRSVGRADVQCGTTKWRAVAVAIAATTAAAAAPVIAGSILNSNDYDDDN